MKVAKCAGVAAAVALASLAGGSQPADDQIRSNSVLWDSERWRPWVVSIDPDGITHLIGYNALLAGHLKLTSADDIEPRRVPFGFLGPRDTLRWRVRAPSPGTYSVAVLYAPGEAGVGSPASRSLGPAGACGVPGNRSSAARPASSRGNAFNG